MANSNHNALARFLERLLLRSNLDAKEQEAILNLRSHASQVAAHRDIVSPGEKVNHACLVVDGLAARFDQMQDGQRQFTAFHIPGDMCDLQSVVVPVAGWGIQSVATTTVLHIPHADLRAVAMKFPNVALAFWRDTTADASILAKWIGNLGRKNAMARLAHLLCEMGIRMEQADLGSRTEYPFPASQGHMADALGLTSVHTNRTLQTLRADGIVRAERRTVYVTDWERLALIAEFDPEFLLIGRMAEQEAA